MASSTSKPDRQPRFTKSTISSTPSYNKTHHHHHSTITQPDDDHLPTTPSSPKSNLLHLLTFTPRPHRPLLVLSLTTAALLAASRTAYAIILGRIFAVVTLFGAGQLAPRDFLAQIAAWAVWMCVLGLGVWVVAVVDVAGWVLGGELRARVARGEVYRRLGVLGGVGWFEGRGEGGGGLGAGVEL